MAATYVLIASNTVGAGGAASVTFSSISSAYTDLKVVFSARSNAIVSSAGNYLALILNSSSSSFTAKWLYGTGSAAGSVSRTDGYDFYIEPSDYTANTFGNGEFYIPNYAGSTNKSFSGDSTNENNATAADSVLTAGLWSNTAAITSIGLAPYTGSFVQYSTFYLYGIKNS